MITEQYRQHKIFKELETYEDFYKGLSFTVMGFVSHGTTIINFDCYMYSSIQGTIESIRLVLEKGRINDGYALMRKYYDSIMINIYAMTFLDQEHNIMSDKFFLENQIDSWLQGKEKLPGFGKIKEYIFKAQRLKTINSLLYVDSRYSTIRERCNDNMHYNFFDNVTLNDNEIYNNERLNILDTFSADFKDLFVLHFVSMFSISEHYMSSTDHMDYLEMGDTPPEDSQYWVSPFIQEMFDTMIKVHRPDLAAVLKSIICMQLD